jgi:hypothetical protein
MVEGHDKEAVLKSLGFFLSHDTCDISVITSSRSEELSGL